MPLGVCCFLMGERLVGQKQSVLSRVRKAGGTSVKEIRIGAMDMRAELQLDFFMTKNKDWEIKVDTLHYCHTYGGKLDIGDLQQTNAMIVLEEIPNTLEKMWGENRNWIFVDKQIYQHFEWLPPIVVYAWLVSPKEVTDQIACGSQLFLIWFQDEGVDPFARLDEILESIDWKKEAKDFDY